MNSNLMLVLTAILVIGIGGLLAAYMDYLWNDNIANAYLHSDSVSGSDNDNYGGLDYNTNNLNNNET